MKIRRLRAFFVFMVSPPMFSAAQVSSPLATACGGLRAYVGGAGYVLVVRRRFIRRGLTRRLASIRLRFFLIFGHPM